MEYADIDYTQAELEEALEAAVKSVQNVTTGTRTSTTAPLTFTLADNTTKSVSISAATTSYAGLMTGTHVTQLNRAIYMASVGPRAATTLSLTLTRNSGSTSVTLPAATTSYAGLMTATDKQKLDGLPTSAVTSVSLGTVGSTTVALTVAKSDGSAATVTLPAATTDAAGLMTAWARSNLAQAVKKILAGTPSATQMAINAQCVDGSYNHGAIIPAATTSAAGLMTAADKQKLNGLSSSGPFALKQNLALVSMSGSASVLTDDATGLADYIAGGGTALVMPSASVDDFKTIAHIMNFFDDGTGTGRVTTANWVTYDTNIGDGSGLYGQLTIKGNGTYTIDALGSFTMYNQIKG